MKLLSAGICVGSVYPPPFTTCAFSRRVLCYLCASLSPLVEAFVAPWFAVCAIQPVHRHPLGAPPSAETCLSAQTMRDVGPVKATKELAAVQICGPASPQ